MEAKIVQACVDPRQLPAATDAVHHELIPQFLTFPGARVGYWMADRSTGQILALTLWDSTEALLGSAAVDGVTRSSVAERLGLRVLAVQHMEVVGAHQDPMGERPEARWARATWVDSIVTDVHGHLPALFAEAVPDQARTHGFCASYWMVDRTTGSGLGLSLWEGPAELSASELRSRRRRRRLEGLLGCVVGAVSEYTALGVAAQGTVEPGTPVARADPTGDVAGGAVARSGVGNGGRSISPVAAAVSDGARFDVRDFCDLTWRSGLGTTLRRPPGAVLAMRGDLTNEVVVLLEGGAATVRDHMVEPLEQGALFGAHGVLHRRPHRRTVVATTPVEVHVFSRMEFAAVGDYLPSVARVLLRRDLEAPSAA